MLEEVLRNSSKEREEVEVEVTVLAHSIGGWIARAWLSRHLSPEKRSRISKLVTVGSPHNAPPQGSLAATLDQRGAYWRQSTAKCLAASRAALSTLV